MKVLILLVSVLLSGNLFAECVIDAQIKALEVTLQGYKDARDKAWSEYRSACFPVAVVVNTCWYCDLAKSDYRMLYSGNTMPVENCSKISCALLDPGTGAVIACTGINLPIAGTMTEDCKKWCTDWHAQDDSVTSTAATIAELEATRATICAPSSDPCATDPNSLQCKCITAGKTWSANTNTCCQDGANVAQCLCEADMKHKWDSTKNVCAPMGTGPISPPSTVNQSYIGGIKTNPVVPPAAGSLSSTPKGTASATAASSPGGMNIRSPGGTGAASKGKNWYDSVANMLNPSRGGSGSSRPGAGGPPDAGQAAIGAAGAGAVVDNTKTQAPTAGINGNGADVFQIVAGMYQNRYYSGLIGGEISPGTIKTNIKASGAKKPVTYR
jgi:hypothetical protein